MKRLLITGGSGYLGSHLGRLAAGAWQVTLTYFSHPAGPASLELDLCDPAAVSAAVQRLRPDAIVHTACSNDSPAQIQAILPAARNLAVAAQAAGSRLVHVSTDLVFDGEHAPYADDDRPAPVQDYGQVKAEAEALVAEHTPGAAIVRPSLIWGLDPLDRQTRWLVDGLQRGQPLTFFTDEIRCPVYAPDLAAALLELAARPELAGPFNAGGAQALSRWDFGQRLLAILNLDARGLVRPGLARASGLTRPRDLTLRLTRAERELRTRLRAVDEVLAELRAARTRQPRFCEG